MKAIIYISGEIGKETTLTDVIRQFKSYDEPTEVLAKITSAGGYVDKGDAIYDYLKALKASMPVNTWTDKAYSIAAKIFSVGDIRTVEEGDKRIMIHFAWANVTGKAEKLELVAEALRKEEDEFASYYAEFLNVDEETARNLLDNDTFISGEEAVSLGFATEIQTATKAVAKLDNDNFNLKPSKMSKKDKKGNALLNAIKAFLSDDAELKALMLQDSDGTEIDFPDLEEGDIPKVGDVANIDGEDVPDGERVMPSLDNATVNFVDSKIESIVEAEEESEEEIQAKENEAKEKETEVKAEEVQQISVWQQEAVNTSFEVGDQMEYEYDGETYPFGAGEYYVPSLKKNVVTDASGVIVAHKEAVVPSEAVVEDEEDETEVSAKILEDFVDKIETKISAKFEAKFSDIETENKRLKKMIGSKEFKAENREDNATDGKKPVNGLTSILKQNREKK